MEQPSPLLLASPAAHTCPRAGQNCDRSITSHHGAWHHGTAAPSACTSPQPLPGARGEQQGCWRVRAGAQDRQTDRQTASGMVVPSKELVLSSSVPSPQLHPDFPGTAEFSSQHRHRVLYLGLYFSVPKSGALEGLVGYSCLTTCSPLPCQSQLCLPLPCHLTKTRLQSKPGSWSYEQVFIC